MPSARTPLLSHASPQPDGSSRYSSTERQDDGSSVSSDEHKVPAPIRTRLYVSHALSTWNSRVFEIGAVLYLASIYPGTLQAVSIYALARGASAAVLSPVIGQYIDTCNRLRVVWFSIVLQRSAIAASCLLFWSLVGGLPWALSLKSGALAILTVLACIEKLCSVTICVAIEKDWVVEIANGDEAALKKINPQMRRIDLLSTLAGPVFISTLATFSTELAILVTFAMNLTSIPIECHTIASVYHRVPALSDPKPPRPQKHSGPLGRLTTTLHTALRAFSTHARHPAALPSLASAMLAYTTALTLSGQTITYLLAAGFTPLHVAAAQAASTAIELSATWVTPRVTARIGVLRTAAAASAWQAACVAAAATAFFCARPGEPLVAAAGLVGCAAVARIGLWGFRMSVQTIVQEEVEEPHRGAFSAVEAAWANAFEMAAYATTVVVARPEQFRWPVLGSCVAVWVAGALYAVFLCGRRGCMWGGGKGVGEAGWEGVLVP